MKLPTTLPTIAMTRTRWFAVAGVVAALGLGGVGLGVAASRDASSPRALPAPASTTTTSSTTSTTAAPTTTLVADPGGLHSGSTGADVQAVQQRLRDLHYDPGAVDGNFGLATTYAVQAFEKLNGMAPDGRVDVAFLAALASPAPVVPLVPGGGANRVEVDLKHQVLFVYLGDQLRLITHVSTGSNQRYCVEGSCQMAVTPIGAFRFSWRASGWREARLGKLYNPVYFTSDGVAVHGSQSVPTYPASHGCVRIPMHIAEYFPSLVKRGDPIYVTDGRAVGPPPAAPSSPPTTDKPATSGDASTTTTSTTAPPTSTTAPPTSTTTTASTTTLPTTPTTS